MNHETKDLQKVELQYCVQCPTCNETFKIKPDECSFTQTCVFCRSQFQVVADTQKQTTYKAVSGIGVR